MKLLDFASQEFVIFTTYKRDKTRVPTVVWIAQNKNYSIVKTINTAGKVKRVRTNSNVALCEINRNGTERIVDKISG